MGKLYSWYSDDFSRIRVANKNVIPKTANHKWPQPLVELLRYRESWWLYYLAYGGDSLLLPLAEIRDRADLQQEDLAELREAVDWAEETIRVRACLTTSSGV